MAKGKYVFVYGDNFKLTDRNGYKTLAQAQAYMRSYNKNTRLKKNKIVKIMLKNRKRRNK